MTDDQRLLFQRRAVEVVRQHTDRRELSEEVRLKRVRKARYWLKRIGGGVLSFWVPA